MLSSERVETADSATAYYPGGSWEYTKTFHVPDDYVGKAIFLQFEGVYRSALVTVNGTWAGHHPFGYSGFTLRIDELIRPGQDNVVQVEATAGNDSRWYSGAGIYRNVHLLVGNPIRVAVDGLQVTTLDLNPERALVEVRTVVENDSSIPVRHLLATEIAGPDGLLVARESTSVTSWPSRPQIVRQRLTVSAPACWSVDEPHLYTCTVNMTDEDRVSDQAMTTFGIRTVRIDPTAGLRVNGDVVKLRGASVHHDNGILGSATIERAEERRVELLKAAGFNALRSAHNPMSEAMLNACDRRGMLVLDEAFDSWTQPKTGDDYAQSFPEWWQADLAAMVTKDLNHPCVILYSLGNEIGEIGHPDGARRTREMAEYVRSLDPSRYVTMGVNPVHACGAELFADPSTPPPPDQGVNALMAIMQDYLPRLLCSETVDKTLQEAFGAIDVAGYNYVETRYELDHRLHPHRIILGTETMPPLIGRYWRIIRDNPHVIGDFTWTGWDYLGEAGIGRIDRGGHNKRADALQADYPWLTAGTGDLDLTGHRRPVSHFREIVYGLRTDPYIAVQSPESHGAPVLHHSPWALTDAVASWSWPGFDGQMVTVEVYSPGDEVELFVNGESVGRSPAGERVEFRTAFETSYRPGTVEAVAFQDGKELGRMSIRSAGADAQVRAHADRADIRCDGTDLAFITVELTDAEGIVHVTRDQAVAIAVDGPAVLAGFGSAEPSSEESFKNGCHRTYQGRALAAVRPTGTGEITVTVTSGEMAPVRLVLSSVAS
jgi:beta-galactosidase